MDDIAMSWRPEFRAVIRPSKEPEVNSNLTPSCLPRASAMSGSTPTIFPFSTDSIGAYSAFVPTLITPDFWYFSGSLENSGAPLLVSFTLPLSWEALSVWSPQAVSSREPATAMAPTAAIRALAVVQRLVLAVMTGTSGR